MHNYYNDFFEQGQQVINFNLYQIGLPKYDPVYALKKVMEEMDFSKLIARYSRLGRKGYNPIMIFSVLIYASLRGVRSVDRIVELCNRDIAFMWLAQGESPKRDVFYDFMNNKLDNELLSDLHYQFIRKLQKEGLVTLESLFIEGTKVEANANRYTFVWRGSVNYRLANLLDSIDALYERYNILISSNKYDSKYKIATMKMFVIDGVEKVKSVIKENRIRKVNKKKKLANNTIIEIDNISPLELLKMQVSLTTIANSEGIVFSKGKGQKKHELQKIHEELEELGQRLLKYKASFELMGTGRNSYSKTDVEATFMRMKDDHMRNGQLKPAYNLQIAVENYFVIHSYISPDRTDYNPLIPVLRKHHKNLGFYPQNVTADSGYCSKKNLLFLSDHKMKSFIKLQSHEKMKTRAYKNDISQYRNMKTIEDGFICANNRLITHDYRQVNKKKDFIRTYEVYSCKDCSNCHLKADCLYKYDESKDKDKNKTLKVNKRWDELKNESNKNIQSDEGVIKRQIRSIQTEGFFET